jgi:hypothetical protein
MEVKKDNIWEAFIGAETFEAFQKNFLNSVYLNPKVSDDVKGLIIIVQKLLRHSYFEYEFIDVALTQAIFAFEKALRIRWTEIHGEPTKRILAGLIDWFYERNYFETWNKEIPHQLRHIRNNKAHDEKKSLGGVAFLHKVFNTIDLINDLYEDIDLRIHRKREMETLSKQFNSLFKKGGILLSNDQKLIIFNAYLVFINNKFAKKVVNVSACPIFDLSPYKEGKHFVPGHIQFSLSEWVLDDDRFTAIDTKTGKPIVIATIDSDANRLRFDAWEEEFYSIKEWPLILYLVTEPLNDYFIKTLRKFHQQ